MRELEWRAEALAGTFNAQDVANTLWAYATIGRAPGSVLMRELEGRAEAVAGTFKAQEVANSLWSACVFAILRAVEGESRLIHTLSQRLVSLGDAACFNTTELSQLHQYFLWCSMEPRFGVEAIKEMQSLKEACRSAFETSATSPSATQQQVSETLRHMGLWVEDEVRCPKSGYSIDMHVVAFHPQAADDSGRRMGGERSSSTGTWAVEFDGPSHFLTGEQGANGCHSAEATASPASGPHPRHRALLGVGRM
jgi:hypothetical protein